MDEHFVKRDRESRVVAVNDHGSGVSNKADIDASGVEVDRRRVIIGSDDRDGLTVPIFLLQLVKGHSMVGRLRLWAAIDGVLRDVAHATNHGGSGD